MVEINKSVRAKHEIVHNGYSVEIEYERRSGEGMLCLKNHVIDEDEASSVAIPVPLEFLIAIAKQIDDAISEMSEVLEECPPEPDKAKKK